MASQWVTSIKLPALFYMVTKKTNLIDDLAALAGSYLSKEGQYQVLCDGRVQVPHIPGTKANKDTCIN